MIVLRVDDRDLSAYVRVAVEEGLTPAPFEGTEPQFGGNPAFAEGAAFTGDAVNNAERVFPLILSADSTAALHQLIRDIEADLVRGAVVEFAPDDTETSSYFDLEAGRLEIDYEHWIGRAGHLRATLRCWTRPYANTGTARTVASLAAGAGFRQFSVTGVLGDVAALANLEVRTGSQAAGNVAIGYGVHPSASYNAIRGPSSADFVSLSGATMSTAGGFSEFVRIPVSPTGPSASPLLRSYLTPPGGHVGRHRVIAICRSRLSAPITLSAQDRFGAPLGPTTAAQATNTLHLVDLGEIHVPARDPRQEPVPTQVVVISGAGASGASINASPAFELNRLIYLPLDTAPGLMIEDSFFLAARQWARFESWPERRAVQANASVFQGDLTANLRGAHPQVPPVGSPGASGPAQMVIFCGDEDAFEATDDFDVHLDVVERWAYLRP